MVERGPLAVAVAQPVCRPGDVAANVAAHADAVRTAGARLVVFPELSLTGYVLDAPAVDLDGGVLGLLVDACAAAGVVAVVGAPIAEGVDRLIAMLEVSATGVRVAYRKMCLGGDEPQFFRAGAAAGVVEVDGWRVGIGVCKDTRMAVHLDAVRGAGIDLYVAGLVHHRHEVGELEVRARRIAAQMRVPMAFASAAGDTGPVYPDAAGCSAIWDRDGSCVAACGGSPGSVAHAVLVP